jgi:hypothetical protein
MDYQNKYLSIKNQIDCSILIGNSKYNIGNIYYIAGTKGNNPQNYPRLTNFSDAIIDKFGNSTKYPDYNFNFELFEDNNFDSELANIYKLIITIKDNSNRLDQIDKFKHCDRFKHGDRFRISLNGNLEYGSILHRRTMYGDAYGGTYMVEYDNPKIKIHNASGDSMELV